MVGERITKCFVKNSDLVYQNNDKLTTSIPPLLLYGDGTTNFSIALPKKAKSIKSIAWNTSSDLYGYKLVIPNSIARGNYPTSDITLTTNGLASNGYSLNIKATSSVHTACALIISTSITITFGE